MNNIDSIEERLGTLLSPRQANPEFVKKLKYRLTSEPAIKLESNKQLNAVWILTSALFFGGLLLFIISFLHGKSGKSKS